MLCNIHLGSPQIDGLKRLESRKNGRQGGGARRTEAVRAASRVCVGVRVRCMSVSNTDPMMQLALMILYPSQPLVTVTFTSLSVKPERRRVLCRSGPAFPPACRPLIDSDRRSRFLLPKAESLVSLSSQSPSCPLTHRASLSLSLRLTSRRARPTRSSPPSIQTCPPPCRVCARACAWQRVSRVCVCA